MTFKNFISSCRSIHTKDLYERMLKSLVDDPDDFIIKSKTNRREAEDFIIEKIDVLKESNSPATVRTKLAILKSFLAFEEVYFNIKRVNRAVDKGGAVGRDRPPSKDEIRKLLEFCTIRDKAVVMILLSCGCRVGAFDWFNVGDYVKLDSGVGRLRIYRGTDDEHYSFITPEAVSVLDQYLMKRRSIEGNLVLTDPLISYNFNKDKNRPSTWNKGGNSRFSSRSMRGALFRLWSLSGLKEKGDRSVKAAHGFRKYFKTHTGQVMKSDDVEILMGHSLGIASHYYKPDLDYLAGEYLKAVPLLTISEVDEVRRDTDKRLAVSDKRFEQMERVFLQLQTDIEELKRRQQ